MTASTSSRLASRSAAITTVLIATVIGSVAGSVTGCSAILKPNDDVERCGNAEDCSPTGDNRYVPICKFDDENTGLDTTKVDKICVADFKSIGCDPSQYTGTSMANNFKDTAEDATCVDLGCSDENAGKPGCRPAQGTSDCQFGSPDDDGFCGDPDADQPVIPAVFLGDDELKQDQHVRDQFCKSYFCDDTFVCNAQSKCEQCDPEKPFGQGGCGIVYAEGAPAKVYVLGGDLEDQCAGEDVQADEPAVFGACD